VTPICFFLHELATNSIKYGALRDSADVAVSWRKEEETIVLIWSEATKQSPNIATSEPGFGSMVMQIVSRQLGGEIKVERDKTRLIVTLSFNATAA
jgi:two-component sensor histidine kinase